MTPITLFLAIATLALSVALALVVILGKPTNAIHLLAWGLIALGASLVLAALARSR